MFTNLLPSNKQVATTKELNLQLASMKTNYEQQLQTHKEACVVLETIHSTLEEWLKKIEALLAQAQQES